MRSVRIFAVLCALAAHAALIAIQHLGILPGWLAELTRFVPYYWMLVPVALCVPLAWGLPKGLFSLSLGNLGLLLVLTMGLQLNWPASDNQGGARLRVLTFNVKALNARHQGGGFTHIEQEILLHQPDVVALQDAQHWLHNDSDVVPTPAPPMLRLPHVVGVDQFVLASRFPLSHCRTEQLLPPTAEFVFVALLCELDVSGTKLTVLTAHLVSPRESLLATRSEVEEGLSTWRNNFAKRLEQAQAIAKVAARVQGPLLVLGDFNAAEGSPVIETLKRAGLHDTFADAGRGWGYTYGHALSKGLDFLRIDHILASTGVRASHTEVGGEQASDHSPVIADVSF